MYTSDTYILRSEWCICLLMYTRRTHVHIEQRFTHLDIYLYMFICTFLCVCIYEYISHTFVYIHIYICKYTNLYAHICTFTYINI